MGVRIFTRITSKLTLLLNGLNQAYANFKVVCCNCGGGRSRSSRRSRSSSTCSSSSGSSSSGSSS
uniref:Uncharacterized protein LOC104224554 n=1 Tax=Nicotiana sylvestris TaxID=4096 RepID=A0A1U7WBC8_NICSY